MQLTFRRYQGEDDFWRLRARRATVAAVGGFSAAANGLYEPWATISLSAS